MKKFISRFILFCLLTVGVLCIVDIGITSTISRSNGPQGEFQVWNDIYDGSLSTDIAIYGSSRAWVHINPEILQDSLSLSAYNFGIDGHNFWLQYLRHKKYLAYNIPPKVVVLSVDAFSLTKRQDLYLSEQFLPYMLWDQDVRQFTHTYKGFSWVDYYIPMARYVGMRKVLSKAFDDLENPPIRTKGYRGINKSWNNDFKKAQRERRNFRLTIDAETAHLLEQFVLECKSKNIELVFVYTPEYYEGQNFVKNRNEIMSHFKSLSTQYQIPFLDYSNDSLNRNKDYFYNASHLNKKGAELFSRQLGSDLKTLLQNH